MTMPPPGIPVPPVHHVWTAGPSDRGHFTWLSTRQALTRWQLWLIIVVVVGFTASRASSIGAGIGIAIFLLPLLVGVIVALTWFSSHRALGRTMFPGAQWATGFNDHGFMLASPTGTLTFDWGTVTAIRPSAELVTLQTKTGRIGIPAPLVPPPAVAYAAGQIARQQAVSRP
ncbi:MULTISPECIES: hypothetical protein [Mycobacteriaceae]|uniref:YcxB-like protein domain-containing protein n=1 Tax=Mycolicibacterium mucogenicum DSM 44124 TaxID=1226753 RepID=A0A8H2JB61_MYCMU|nr:MULTISPECIES: hypothetical protein [Mycobacteriaceae]KAB7757137.1 hypothetical protein MMUC44124_15805 [Mycolicibacterium mucogenicum DSM 44124]QPG70583.1 hypothetical protein C1S78_006310 [Mycolicibacterium mucogenicum DSM 44124]SEB26830.1 hypothetical protein SAMN04488580_12338 [Mycobacterium sp. 283mftsu]